MIEDILGSIRGEKTNINWQQFIQNATSTTDFGIITAPNVTVDQAVITAPSAKKRKTGKKVKKAGTKKRKARESSASEGYSSLGNTLN